jgi:hypothetical protein
MVWIIAKREELALWVFKIIAYVVDFCHNN